MPHKDPAERRAYWQRYNVEKPHKRRAWNRKHHYGLTSDGFNSWLLAQMGACPGCGTPISDETAMVDHCHASNKVRGLLCRKCNLALGHVNDDPEILRRLTKYIEGRG